MQRIGALVIDFQAARANASAEVKIESVRCAGCGTSQPPSASGNCVKCGKALPRVTFSPLAGGKRRCGACGGAISYSDGQSTGAGGGGAGAIAGATGGYFIGFSGALTIMFGLMALGSVVALFSVRFRCDSCWEVWPARLLHGDERRAMAKQRLIYLVVAIWACCRPDSASSGGCSRPGTSCWRRRTTVRATNDRRCYTFVMSQFTPLSALAGGALIALGLSGMLLGTGRIAGISGVWAVFLLGYSLGGRRAGFWSACAIWKNSCASARGAAKLITRANGCRWRSLCGKVLTRQPRMASARNALNGKKRRLNAGRATGPNRFPMLRE